MNTTDEQIAALKAAALAATPQNIDSAQRIDHYDDGSRIECPACGGEGNVELEADFCNYDGTAIGVQFYGIGNAHGAAEAYLRAATPSNVLALIERLERAESALATTPQTDGATVVLTDEEIIERCKAAGIKWIPPEPEYEEDGNEVGFPGLFDMVSMSEMRHLLAATPVPQTGSVTVEHWTTIARKWIKPDSESSPEFYWGDFYDCVRKIIAATHAPALTDEQIEDLQEAREILENMVRSIELDGNYSTEATCTFLRQALMCIPTELAATHAPAMAEPEPGTTEYGSWVNKARNETDMKLSFHRDPFKYLCQFQQELKKLAAASGGELG